MLHPKDALVETGVKSIPTLPVCEHFCGSQKLAEKILPIQHELGPVFDITLDLEDGAPKGREQANLDEAIDIIRSDANRFNRIGMRIHDYHNHWWKKEIRAIGEIVRDKIAYITIPKLGCRDQYRTVSTGTRRSTGQWIPKHIIIESQAAWHNIAELASANCGLEVLDFGLMDFTADYMGVVVSEAMSFMGAALDRRVPSQFDHNLIKQAKVDTVKHAIYNGLIPAHNVTLSTENDQALSDAKIARTNFGFLRMWSIHPRQISLIIEGMREGLGDVVKASNVLLKAQEASWGPIKYEGKLEDRATYRYYWSIIKQARATGMKLPEEAEARFFAN